MKHQTLFLIQSSDQATPHILHKLAHLATANDAIVLMGDAVLHVENSILLNKSVYILENEAENLASNLSHIQVIAYTAFADLVLQSHRSISLK